MGVPRWVDATYDLAQPTLTDMALSGALLVYRYDVGGKVYDADDLGQAFRATNKYAGEPSGDAFVAKIETSVRSAVEGQLASSFPGAAITGVTATVDRATLLNTGGDPFDPPVRVAFSANVARTREQVGLGTFSDASIAAAFDAGARVMNDLTLKADEGYDATYVIRAPATPGGLAFSDASEGASVAADGQSFRVRLDNTQGGAPERAVSVALRDPSVAAPAAEDIRSSVDVRMGELRKGAKDVPILTSVTADVRAVKVSERFPGLLPSKVKLDVISADGLRALRATGALDDATLGKANEAMLSEISGKLGGVFGTNTQAVGGLSASDLAQAHAKPFRSDPPVGFAANATGAYAFAASSADDVDLALRIGGKASVPLNLFAQSGKETTFTIHPMPGAEFAKAEGGTLTANGLTATFVVPEGAASYPATLTIRGKDVPSFDAADADIGIKVDLTDLDVTIGKAMSGDFGNLVMDVTVTGKLGVIALPDEIKGGLPANLDLAYLSSDSIRLLKDRGLLSDANLTKVEQSLMTRVSTQLGQALGGEFPVEGGFDRASLAASLVSTPISGDVPITFTATARVTKPLAGGAVQPGAAIALYTQQLPLSLPRVEGMDTTYTIVLPRGLAVTGLDAGGAQSEQGKSPDGRDQFTVTPSEDRADVVVSMAVTPTFVLLKFWPLVLLAVLLLVLVIGTPIALVMAKRRRGKAKKE